MITCKSKKTYVTSSTLSVWSQNRDYGLFECAYRISYWKLPCQWLTSVYNYRCIIKQTTFLTRIADHVMAQSPWEESSSLIRPETCFPSSAIFWSRGRTCWTNTTKEQRPFPTRSLLITQQRTNTHFVIKSNSLQYLILYYREHVTFLRHLKTLFIHAAHRNANANERANVVSLSTLS